MASLRRENLVRDGKFDRTEVMRRAWAYVKNPFCTQYRNGLKGALKQAWADARCVVCEMKQDEPKFNGVNLYEALRACSSSIDMRYGTVCM